MSINSNFKNGTASEESRRLGKTSSNSAMHRWFECNQGLQRKSWPSVYQPTYQYTGLQKPDGVGEEYWDTLARAEKRWISDPVKSQFDEELTDFWNDRSEPKVTSSAEYFVNEASPKIQPDLDIIPTADLSARLVKMEAARQYNTRARSADDAPVQIFSRQFSYGALNPAWKFAASW